MKRKIILAACLALACAGLMVTMRPSVTNAADPRVERLHERLLLLDGYLEHYANANYSFYPTVAQVLSRHPRAIVARQSVDGRPMQPGTGAGDFTYAVGARRLSYTLTARYPGGVITIHSSVPYTRKMQNDHRSGELGELLQYFADLWAQRHDGRAPSAEQMAFDAGVGKQPGVSWWPHNPWTHEPMGQGGGWGDFTYKVDPGSGVFSIIVHYSRGDTRTYRGPFSKTLASSAAGVSTRFR